MDRWIFQQDPDRYKDHLSVADRMVAGMIQPPTLEGLLDYFSLKEGEWGEDALKYSWLEEYRQDRPRPPSCFEVRMAQIPIVHNLHQEFVLYVSIVDTGNTMDEVCQTAARLSIGFEKNQQAGCATPGAESRC